jgi:hypothetical protein
VLLTRAPLYSPLQAEAFSYDLHVLSTPPAFTLSQDQTLQLNLCLAAEAAIKQGSQLKTSSLFSFQRSKQYAVVRRKIFLYKLSCKLLSSAFFLFFLNERFRCSVAETYIFSDLPCQPFSLVFPKEIFQERLIEYHTMRQQVNDISNDRFARKLHDPSKR